MRENAKKSSSSMYPAVRRMRRVDAWRKKKSSRISTREWSVISQESAESWYGENRVSPSGYNLSFTKSEVSHSVWHEKQKRMWELEKEEVTIDFLRAEWLKEQLLQQFESLTWASSLNTLWGATREEKGHISLRIVTNKGAAHILFFRIWFLTLIISGGVSNWQ